MLQTNQKDIRLSLYSNSLFQAYVNKVKTFFISTSSYTLVKWRITGNDFAKSTTPAIKKDDNVKTKL